MRLLCGMHGESGRPKCAQLLSKTPYKALRKQQTVQVHTVTDHGLTGWCKSCSAGLWCQGWSRFWHEARTA